MQFQRGVHCWGASKHQPVGVLLAVEQWEWRVHAIMILYQAKTCNFREESTAGESANISLSEYSYLWSSGSGEFMQSWCYIKLKYKISERSPLPGNQQTSACRSTPACPVARAVRRRRRWRTGTETLSGPYWQGSEGKIIISLLKLCCIFSLEKFGLIGYGSNSLEWIWTSRKTGSCSVLIKQ